MVRMKKPELWQPLKLPVKQYLCMVVAACSVLGCASTGVTLVIFLSCSGVFGFNDGYKSLLDLTSCCTPREDTTPLL